MKGWSSTKSAASAALSSSELVEPGVSTHTITPFGHRCRARVMNGARFLSGGVASLMISSISVRRRVRSASSSEVAVKTEVSSRRPQQLGAERLARRDQENGLHGAAWAGRPEGTGNSTVNVQPGRPTLFRAWIRA